VLQERSTSAATESANGLQRALTSRIRIEQAKGILAERVGVGVDEAFEFLRRYSRRHQAGITVIAEGVVRRELDITPRQRSGAVGTVHVCVGPRPTARTR
jgi:AmiR/NasT family two-component response regulator